MFKFFKRTFYYFRYYARSDASLGCLRTLSMRFKEQVEFKIINDWNLKIKNYKNNEYQKKTKITC